MRKYKSYSNSNVLWNKSFPSHWEVLPLYALAKEKSICNCTDLPLLSVYLDAGVILFSAREEKRTNVTSKDLSKYQRVDMGDFVLNNQQAWRGSVGISFDTGIVSPAYIVLRMNDRLNSRYANYLFRSRLMVDQYLINSKSVGSIQRNIYWTSLKRTHALVPPSTEQDQIVRFLDWKISSINKLINIKLNEIKKLEELKKAIINNAVTKGLDATVNFKDSGYDFIGNIPSHWTVIKMKWLLSSPLQYGANSTGIEYNSSLPRYIRITDITMDNKLKDTGKQSLPLEIAEPYILDDGDILFARSGATVGKSFIYKDEYERSAFAGYLIRAKISCDKAIADYIYAATLSKYYELWKDRIFIQSTIQNISAEKYNNLPIPVPPLSEQKDIVLYINERTISIESVIENVERYIKELTELKNRLIFDVVIGKIDVRKVDIPKYETVDDVLLENEIPNDGSETSEVD